MTFQVVGKGGRGCLDLGKNICGSGSGGTDVWVGDVGDDTAHWERVGRIPPLGDPQEDGTETLEWGGQEVDVSPTDVNDGGCGVTGGGYLRLPPPEHICTVNCDQAHYGPVHGSG